MNVVSFERTGAVAFNHRLLVAWGGRLDGLFQNIPGKRLTRDGCCGVPYVLLG